MGVGDAIYVCRLCWMPGVCLVGSRVLFSGKKRNNKSDGSHFVQPPRPLLLSFGSRLLLLPFFL